MNICHTPGCGKPAPYYTVNGQESYYHCRECSSANAEALRQQWNREHQQKPVAQDSDKR